MPTPTFSAYIAGQTSTNPEDKYSNEIAGWATSNKYDVFNQLIETVAGKSVINVYNGEGLRTRKISGGKSAYYLYVYDKIVLETDSYGKETVRNVYGTHFISRRLDKNEKRQILLPIQWTCRRSSPSKRINHPKQLCIRCLWCTTTK